MNILLLALLGSAASAISGDVSSDLNDYNLSLDAEERRLVFARSQADFREARIYVAEHVDGGWSAPAPIVFSDERYSDSDPWLTSDGRTLFFISNRPSPDRDPARTDYDIWRSILVDGVWTTPVRMGPEINSAGEELGPELHGDTLYFASARRSGAGGLDIYRSRVVGDGFARAELLAAPFNSAASESDFTLSADGQTAMFWRSVGNRGLIHIARREGDDWGTPVPLPDTVNIGPFNFTPSFSADGRSIRFASTLEREGQPAGLADIYERGLPTE